MEHNPYAPPGATLDAGVPLLGQGSARFKATLGLARAAIAAMTVERLLDWAGFAWKAFARVAPATGRSSQRVPGAALLLDFAALMAGLAGFVLLLLWVYRAATNARARGSPYMTFSPAWSVAWFLVPIASWVQPYRVLSAIARASDEEGQGRRPTALLLWWLINTPAGIMSWLFIVFRAHVRHREDLLVIPSVLSTVAVVALAWSVHAIERGQAQWREAPAPS